MVFSDVCGWYVCIVFGMVLKIYIAVSCKKYIKKYNNIVVMH